MTTKNAFMLYFNIMILLYFEILIFSSGSPFFITNNFY